MSVSVKYKNSEIAALTASGTKTLLTKGKYCEDNIIVTNTESGESGSSSKEVWMLKESVTIPQAVIEGDVIEWNASFTTNTQNTQADDYTFTQVYMFEKNDACGITFRTIDGGNIDNEANVYSGQLSGEETHVDLIYSAANLRVLTFLTPPSGELLEWLQENGEKITGGYSVTFPATMSSNVYSLVVVQASGRRITPVSSEQYADILGGKTINNVSCILFTDVTGGEIRPDIRVEKGAVQQFYLELNNPTPIINIIDSGYKYAPTHGSGDMTIIPIDDVKISSIITNKD